MIVSKRNGKVDAEIFLQHLREGPDGDFYVQTKHLNSPTKKMLGYFMGHITPIFQRFLSSSGIFMNKNQSANTLKEAVGFGEPIIDFDLDMGLTESEWQEMIDRSFHKLIDLGCNPVHPKDR